MANNRMSAEERRSQIINGFYSLIQAQGMENASIGKLAKYIGIPQGLIYHYFPQKKSMFTELVLMIEKEYEKALVNLIEQAGPAKEKLNSILDSIFSREFFEDRYDFVFATCSYLSFRNHEVKSVLNQIHRHLKDKLVELLDEYSGQSGITIPDQSFKADFIIIQMYGIDELLIRSEGWATVEPVRDRILNEIKRDLVLS